MKELEDILDKKCFDINKILDPKDKKKKIKKILEESFKEFKIDKKELKFISLKILEYSTKNLKKEVKELIAEKEKLDNMIKSKTHILQNERYEIFDLIEECLLNKKLINKKTSDYLHNLRIQYIDILDVLKELCESAIITTIENEKNKESIQETTYELIKNITYQTLNEGILSSARIRKVVSTILGVTIEIVQTDSKFIKELLQGTIEGLNKGITKSIKEFKNTLNSIEMKEKLKNNDIQALYEELHNTDTLFTQIITAKASQSKGEVKMILEDIANNMHPKLNEMINISKETIEIVREKIKEALLKGKKSAKEVISNTEILNQETLNEAKKRAKNAKESGIRLFNTAKNVFEGALQGAKEAMNKQNKKD